MTPKFLAPASISKWVLLPMRLFLGVTFCYAGIQKLLDPQFFRPDATGYIGRQLLSFAAGSPLRPLLLQAVPHATLFGLLVAYGEIAIGLGTLVGLLLRPAALFGMLISIVFYLSASWHVYPYFYGSDIVFTFCWLTLLINGPLNTGLPTLDALLTLKILERTTPQRQTRIISLLSLFLGTHAPTQSIEPEDEQSAPQTRTRGPQTQQQRISNQKRLALMQQRDRERRNFIWGLVTGITGVLGIGGLIYALHVLQQGDTATQVPLSSATPTATSVTIADTPGATSTATTVGSSNVIAHVSAVPKNSSTTFTLASNNDPGILVHLDNDQFVAFDATCTHAGCPVDYDPSNKLLVCPCHGAAFDPAQNALVVQSPARDPLTAVAIHVDSATGAITLAG